MNVSDVIAARLRAAGCKRAYGMPGGEVLTLVEALRRAGIEFVLARHENAAAFMAEAEWHRTGAPGVLVATLGPGALNGVNAVANAWQDRVPLIVLAGAVDADEAAVYTHQVLDQTQVFRPITKASFTMSAGAAGVIIDKAVGIAMEGRPGPVHIDLPISVAAAPAKGGAVLRPAASAVALAGEETLEHAQRALAGAQRPIIIAGLDALNDDGDLQSFAEVMGAPVITTYKAKGVLPEDHPLAMGGAGLSPKADAILLPLVSQADVVICVGYDPIEMRTGWQNPWDPERQFVIDIGAEPNHHYMHHATMNVVGDWRATLDLIVQRIEAPWPGGEPARAREALAEAFAPEPDWGPGVVIDTCRAVLPADTVASVDSGAHRILLSQMWRCDFPRALMQSTALCTMGCSVPLAIGAKIADPSRPVVSFSGDAGFLMIAGELATAAERHLPVIFVVFVDRSLALIEKKQRQRQLANSAVDFGWTDFAAVGRAFGGEGHTVRSRQELEAALRSALAAQTFTVIAAEIERGAYDGRI